jgi:hypothetical protein
MLLIKYNNFNLFSTTLCINSPLEQFELLNISVFTNGQFFLASAILVMIFLWFNYNTEALWISSGSRSFSYVIETLDTELITFVYYNVGVSIGFSHFHALITDLYGRFCVLVFAYGVLGRSYLLSLVFTFFFVVMVNLFAVMLPFTFTVTSHIIWPIFFTSFIIFTGLNIYAANNGRSDFFTARFFNGNKLIMMVPVGVVIPGQTKQRTIGRIGDPAHADTHYIVDLIRRERSASARPLDAVERHNLDDFRKSTSDNKMSIFDFRLSEAEVYGTADNGDVGMITVLRRPRIVEGNIFLSTPQPGHGWPVVDGQNNPIPPEPTYWESLLSCIWG